MATNPQPASVGDPKTLEISKAEDETLAEALSRAVIRPTVQSAYTLMQFTALHSEKISLMGLVTALSDQCKAVHGGDLKRAEQMLITQAHTLDAIFGTLARTAALNMREYPEAFERYMRLALKAQGQARATLETLAAIKNPPIVFARQANVTTGPQQVNNGVSTLAREIENQQSKLSGIGNELSSNTGTSALAGGANQALEAVGAVNRAEVKGG